VRPTPLKGGERGAFGRDPKGIRVGFRGFRLVRNRPSEWGAKLPKGWEFLPKPKPRKRSGAKKRTKCQSKVVNGGQRQAAGTLRGRSYAVPEWAFFALNRLQRKGQKRRKKELKEKSFRRTTAHILKSLFKGIKKQSYKGREGAGCKRPSIIYKQTSWFQRCVRSTSPAFGL